MSDDPCSICNLFRELRPCLFTGIGNLFASIGLITGKSLACPYMRTAKLRSASTFLFEFNLPWDWFGVSAKMSDIDNAA